MKINLQLYYCHSDGTMEEQLIWWYHNVYNKKTIKNIKKKIRIYKRYDDIINKLEENKWCYKVLEEILFQN